MPALQSPWFVPHVLAYMISYALAAVAMVMTAVGALRRRADRRGRGAGLRTGGLRSPALRLSLHDLWDVVRRIVGGDGLGRVVVLGPQGNLVADHVDAVRDYFHCRATPSLRPYALPAQVLAFMALLTTFFLVNLLPVWPAAASTVMREGSQSELETYGADRGIDGSGLGLGPILRGRAYYTSA